MHHAYIYEGSLSLLDTLAADARKRFGFEDAHNPDVVVEYYEKFGIDEARELQTTAALKTSSGRGLFVLCLGSITTEAQQALLKLFEEPQPGVTYVLLTPHGTLIATLRSRFMQYPDSVTGIKTKSVAEGFLSMSQKARSDQITKLLKNEDGLRERVRDFLNSIEIELSKDIQNEKAREGLEDIAKVRSYLSDRSPSVKMLLEYLALALPVV
jgi:hypothetical protein